jgi:iron complex transport system ATP-binding protein
MVHMDAPLIEFDNATVVLGGNTVLDSISFSIGVGENVAIIGPNGAGKSALIKTITRDYYPLSRDEGASIRILGEHTWNLFSLRAMLGIVSSDLQEVCNREITGREMVLSGFFGSIGIWPYHKITEEMESRAREILDFLEVAHLADHEMCAMSTGEARRMLIGRALVHDPRALILDEPANALDPHAARVFSATLRRVARAGKSIIMVTHHLHDIIPEISRVIMVMNGRVFRDGPKEDVLTEQNLSELFRMPVEIYERDGFCYLWG